MNLFDSLEQTLGHFPLFNDRHKLAESIDQLKPSQALFIQAEPGSGKTTLLPYLVSKCLADDKLVLVTGPRRLAAIGAAEYAAHLFSEKVGNGIGYAVRGQNKRSASTKVLYVTEGLALRMLQDESMLQKISCVIVDEFHERHVATDILLTALRIASQVKHSGQTLQLRTILMSATFDETKWGKLFEQQSLLKISGQIFPVQEFYLSRFPSAEKQLRVSGSKDFGGNQKNALHTLKWKLVDGLLHLLEVHDGKLPGHVLCFLPGKKEISDAAIEIRRQFPKFSIEEVHGGRDPKEVRIAFEKRRKEWQENGTICVYLATNIAESSLTIPSVRCVVDTGVHRVAKYHNTTHTNELGVEKIGHHSAKQRAGRAAREGQGSLVRLFSEDDFNQRLLDSDPEIATSSCERELLDLCGMLTAFGLNCPTSEDQFLQLPWVTPPNAEVLSRACELFHFAKLFTESDPDSGCSRVSSFGKLALSFPGELRFGIAFAHIEQLINKKKKPADSPAELEKISLPELHMASVMTLLLADSKAISKHSHFDQVVRDYESLRRHFQKSGSSKGTVSPHLNSVCSDALKLRSAQELLSLAQFEEHHEPWLGSLLFKGLFLKVGKRVSRSKLTHQSGESFDLSEELERTQGASEAIGQFYLVLNSIRLSGRRDGTLKKVASLVIELAEDETMNGPTSLFSETVRITNQNSQNPPFGTLAMQEMRIQSVETLSYQNLVLDSQVLKIHQPLFQESLSLWLKSEGLEKLLQAVCFQGVLNRLGHIQKPSLSNFANQLKDAQGCDEVVERLAAHLISESNSSQSVAWSPALLCQSESLSQWLFDYEQMQSLNRLAPLSTVLKNGQKVKVVYSESEVVIEGKIQDFFGLGERHPLLGESASGSSRSQLISPKVRLISPGKQVAAITSDLPQFFKQSYADVKKDYAGKYPRHHWPENPLEALPALTKRKLAARQS